MTVCSRNRPARPRRSSGQHDEAEAIANELDPIDAQIEQITDEVIADRLRQVQAAVWLRQERPWEGNRGSRGF